MSAHGDIGPHRKYLLPVSREEMAIRLQSFRLPMAAMDVPPIVCPGRVVEIEPVNAEAYQIHVNPLDPVSLDDIKSWFGIPNEAAKNISNVVHLGHLPSASPKIASKVVGEVSHSAPRRLNLKDLPLQPEYKFEILEQKQKIAVRRTAADLLDGYVDIEEAKHPQIRAVVTYMINRARQVKPKAFVGTDLVICPGEIFRLNGFAAMVFNNILIYGNGQLAATTQMKIHAKQIRRVEKQ